MRLIKYLLLLGLLSFPAYGFAAELEVCNPSGVRPDKKYVDEEVQKTMKESGRKWPPKVNDFPRSATEKVKVSGDGFEEINRLFFLRGWTDGLPIVPPTPDRVERMLEGVDMPGNFEVGAIKPLDGVATIEKIAVNAVMAGCRPEHMPFLVAAVSGLVNPDFDQLGPATTTGYETHMMIVSGSAAAEIDLNSGSGTLGRGAHGNSALGRAFHLIIQNIGGSAPGVTDMSNHGNPGEFGMCVVESIDGNPWPSVKSEQGFTARSNVVNITAVGSVNQYISIGKTNEQVLDGIADIIKVSANSSRSKQNIWLMPPDVANEFNKAGYDRDKLKAELAKRLGDAGNLYIVVSGGPGEKNLVLGGFYSLAKLMPVEVELPSSWKDLVKESKKDN